MRKTKLLHISSQDHIRKLTAITTLILESCKMSSPLNKTSSKRKNKETLIGYAQDVSEVKRNRSNTTDYVTMRIETSPVKTCQALLYSPQKCKILVHSQQMKTPIKIKDYARRSDDKIVINDMTYVGQLTAGEHSFQYTRGKANCYKHNRHTERRQRVGQSFLKSESNSKRRCHPSRIEEA